MPLLCAVPRVLGCFSQHQSETSFWLKKWSVCGQWLVRWAAWEAHWSFWKKKKSEVIKNERQRQKEREERRVEKKKKRRADPLKSEKNYTIKFSLFPPTKRKDWIWICFWFFVFFLSFFFWKPLFGVHGGCGFHRCYVNCCF